MKRIFALAILASALVGSAVATTSSASVCAKTGSQMEQCCCIEQDGTLVCTLTGQTMSACCCESESM